MFHKGIARNWRLDASKPFVYDRNAKVSQPKYAKYAKYTTSQLLQHVHCIHGWVQVVDVHQLLVLWPTMQSYSRLNGR